MRVTSAFVQDFLQRIYDNGDVYEDVYAGLYCVGCEEFKTEEELVDGKCPIHDTVPEWIEEKNWFFRLSAYQDRLLALYDERPDFVLPHFRYNEARSFIAGGLRDFSISRAGQPWGIPLPWDESQVAYVWADALVNYLSALTYARPGEDLREKLLAGGPPPDGQGHPALPLRLLARDAARGGVRACRSSSSSTGTCCSTTARSRSRSATSIDPLDLIDVYGADPRPLLVRARASRSGRTGTPRSTASTSATSASSGTTSATCSRGRPR